MLALRNPLFGELFMPFERTFADGPAARRVSAYSPAADVRESEKGYTIELDVPGLTEKDIEVTLDERHLVLKGERKAGEGAHYSRRERACGQFERVFHLPEDADLAHIEARARNGVLTVEIPRVESAKPKVIAVKAE